MTYLEVLHEYIPPWLFEIAASDPYEGPILAYGLSHPYREVFLLWYLIDMPHATMYGIPCIPYSKGVHQIAANYFEDSLGQLVRQSRLWQHIYNAMLEGALPMNVEVLKFLEVKRAIQWKEY